MDPKYLNSPEEFRTTIGRDCGVIIDPITYRTAELFFLGRDDAMKQTNAENDQALFSTILSNKGALFAFIDSLVLRKRLPMIAYSMTMYGPEEEPGGAPELLKLCNEYEGDVLQDIRLTHGVYDPIKEDSVNAMNTERPQITDDLRDNVVPALKTFNYRWAPDLGGIQGFNDLSDDDRLLTTFLFGRVLFGRYAQAAQADEVLPPKLGTLHVLSSLTSDKVRHQVQQEVFAGLKAIVQGESDCITAAEEVPWAPTFLPRLLVDDPQTPRDLLKKAIEQRKKPAISNYRNWLEKLESDFDAGREPSPATLRELQRIRQALKETVAVDDQEPIKLKWYVIVAQKLQDLPKVEAKVEGEIDFRPQRLWGWISRTIAGDRYRKVLMDLVGAERRYRKHSVDQHLWNIWCKN